MYGTTTKGRSPGRSMTGQRLEHRPRCPKLPFDGELTKNILVSTAVTSTVIQQVGRAMCSRVLGAKATVAKSPRICAALRSSRMGRFREETDKAFIEWVALFSESDRTHKVNILIRYLSSRCTITGLNMNQCTMRYVYGQVWT